MRAAVGELIWVQAAAAHALSPLAKEVWGSN